jgi:hypothetical protein
MADTFVKIATANVGSGGSAAMDFTSISSVYTDLVLKISARSNYAGVVETCNLQINGITTSTYPARYIQGDGATATSATANVSASFPMGVVSGNNASASAFGSVDIYIPSYTDSSAQQGLSADSVSENNATTSYARISAGLWQNNAAITSISIFPYLGTLWQQYTTATLYGIKNS